MPAYMYLLLAMYGKRLIPASRCRLLSYLSCAYDAHYFARRNLAAVKIAEKIILSQPNDPKQNPSWWLIEVRMMKQSSQVRMNPSRSLGFQTAAMWRVACVPGCHAGIHALVAALLHGKLIEASRGVLDTVQQ